MSRALHLASFLLLLSFAAVPQRDSAEISRDLLYHPARRVDIAAGGGVALRAEQFTYHYEAAAGAWRVTREKNFEEGDAERDVTSFRTTAGVELRFESDADDEQGVLEIIRIGAEGPEQFASLPVWTRERVARAWLAHLQKEYSVLTFERVREDFEPAEPEVAAAIEHGGKVWLAIRHYAGEGWLGVGTLVEIDVAAGTARLYQPDELATASVTHIAAAGGALWLGTHRQREGSIEPAAGLVRFTPSSGEVKGYLGDDSPLAGHVVTALASAENVLWVATDEGVCRVALPAEDFSCWRIVPTVELAAAAPVSNRPGGQPRGRLAAGRYEVRWANVGFLQVVTPDAIEGWLSIDDFEEYSEARFERDAFILANTASGGARVMRLLDRPGGDVLSAPQVYRTALERIGEPTEEGDVRVRAAVGWIARGKLEITPALAPATRQKE